MFNDEAVSETYQHGALLKAIEAALDKMGKTTASVTVEDLAPVDEFHIGGRLATDGFLSQLEFSGDDHVLDVGCGLGGAARYVACKFHSRVTGVDLTAEYVDAGNALCAWTGLQRRIRLEHASALSMPFRSDMFDGAYMLHVGMNIAEKERLFKEVHRVLRPGASFGIYDVMRIGEGELRYPVPWANSAGTSSLATPAQYCEALDDAGFAVCVERSRRDFALDFFRQLRERTAAAGGPPPLGLHTLMKEGTAAKVQNMIDNIAAGYVAPVEMIARKS